MITLQELVTQARKAAEEVSRQRTLPQDDGDLYMDSPGFTQLDHAESAQRAAVHALGQRHAEIQELLIATRSPKIALRNALRGHVTPAGRLLYRGAVYWIDDASGACAGPDAFSSLSSEQLAEKLNYEILADYRHVIIVRPR